MGNLLMQVAGVNSLVDAFHRATDEITGFTENYNMMSVAMGTENLERATKFQNQLANNLGVSMTESTRYQGFFQNMTSSLNIANEESYLLSENLTKLAYDLSSLYNIDMNEAYVKLQSGLIGQTKPLRGLGIDVTQQTLQPYLDQVYNAKYGTDIMVASLSQAEKVMLRYIAIMDQSKNAHGDLALTMQTPANQIRILTAQIQELFRWFGSTFIGLFSQAMPYIIGVASAIAAVMKSIAILMGFNLSSFDQSGRQTLGYFEGIDDEIGDINVGVGDIGSGLGNATKKAKELKGQLADFDELHNLTKPNEDTYTGGGGGYSGGGGGIGKLGNSNLMKELSNSLKGYDNLMSSVSNKANDIRDSIMEWLGFTKMIDTETGEVIFKLKEGNTVFGWLVAAGKTFIALWAGKKVVDMFHSLHGLMTMFGTPFKGVIDFVINKAGWESTQIGSWLLGLTPAKTLLLAIGIGAISFGIYKGLEYLFKGEPLKMDLTAPTEKYSGGIDMLTLNSNTRREYMTGYDRDEAIRRYGQNYANSNGNGMDVNSYVNNLNEQIANGQHGAQEALAQFNQYLEDTFVTEQLNKSMEAIKNAVGKAGENIMGEYYKISTKGNAAITTYFKDQSVLTEQGLSDVYKKYKDSSDVLTTFFEEEKNNRVKDLKELAEYLTDDKKAQVEAEILAIENGYGEQQRLVQENLLRIKEILTGASAERRSLTEAEYQELQQLQQSNNLIMANALTEDVQARNEIMRYLGVESIAINENTGKEILRLAIAHYEEQMREREKFSDFSVAGNKEMYDKITKEAEDGLRAVGKELEGNIENFDLWFENLDGTASKYSDVIKGVRGTTETELDRTNTNIGAFSGKTKTAFSAIDNSSNTMTKQLVKYLSNMGYSGDEMSRMLGISKTTINNVLSNISSQTTSKMGLVSSAVLSVGQQIRNLPNRKTITIDYNIKSAAITGVAASGASSVLASIRPRFYATGGYPQRSELFFANENGNVELIGKQGNKPMVANNMQIIEGIKQGVKEANLETQGSSNNQATNITVPVYIGGKKVMTEVIREIRKTSEETGEFVY